MKKASVKVLFAVALCFGAAATALAVDPDTFAFYSFKDGAAGASAVGVTLRNDVDASHHDGSAILPEANANAAATFSADAPGPYVLSSGQESAELLCSAPQSVYLSSSAASGGSGTLSFADTGTEFSKHAETGFTLEYFLCMAADDTWSGYCKTVDIPAYKKNGTLRTYCLFLPCDNNTRMRYGMGGYGGSYEATGNPVTVLQMNNGQWHHVAVVQQPSGTINIYVDYSLKAAPALSASQVEEVGAGNPVTLGCDHLCGKFSCVRMTKRALDRDEFMRVANRAPAPNVAADPDALAFYPFDDGEVGSSAAGASVTNVAKPRFWPGAITVSSEATASATFDADAPGKYIFVGEHYAATPIYTNPASVFVTSEITGNSGTITFSGLGSKLSQHHARGHTVEYFIKMLDSRFTGYSSHFSCDAGYRDSASHTSPFNLGMPFDMSYSNGRQFRFAIGSVTSSSIRKLSSTEYDLWDGTWHHVALVETNAVVAASGEDPETTNYCVTVFVDYVARGTLQTAGATALSSTDATVVLGNNADHAKYSCLKATVRALESSEFLRASNCATYWPRTAFHWAFDGSGSEAFPSVVTNIAVPSFHDLNSNVYSSAMASLTGNGTVNGTSHAFYSAKRKGGGAPVLDGEGDENPRENGGSAYLESSSDGESGFRTSAYVSHNNASGSSTYAAGRGFTSGDFTAEGFFKFDRAAWLDGMGTYARGRPRVTIMARTRYPNTGSTSAWCVSLQSASSASSANLQLISYSAEDGLVSARSAGGVMVDGRWHHVAVTYDEEAGRIVGYLDYQPFATNILTGPISYGTSGAFVLGLGTSLNNNGYHGWVDEVRYTREALAPSQFLRIDSAAGTVIVVR